MPLPHICKPERFAAGFHHASSDEGGVGGAEFGVLGDPDLRVVAREGEEVEVDREIGDAEGGQARLPRAEDFARSADAQVFFGDAEAVVGCDERFQA